MSTREHLKHKNIENEKDITHTHKHTFVYIYVCMYTCMWIYVCRYMSMSYKIDFEAK